MKSSLKASLALTFATILVLISTSLISRIQAAPSLEDQFSVGFEEYPDIDHVCFIINTESRSDSVQSLPFRFILNDTSIDIAKATARLWEWKPYDYDILRCNVCDVRQCVPGNETGTGEEECTNVTAEDCGACGSSPETKTGWQWSDVEPTNAEMKIDGMEKELRNQFQEVQLSKDQSGKFRLCYYFNEIPIHPRTGTPGSYGHMYLELDSKFYYDFSHSSWWDVDWGKCRSITINHSLIDANLADFPIYVRLDNFSDVQADWDDIRFINTSCNSGGSKLDYELESYNSTYSHWHVRMPYISNSTDTVFSVYYKSPLASDGSNKTGVWDSNFKGVYHLNNSGIDSTSNSRNFLIGSSPAWISGAIGGAGDFKGSRYLYYPGPETDWDLGSMNLTISSWTNDSAVVCRIWDKHLSYYTRTTRDDVDNTVNDFDNYIWGAAGSAYVLRNVTRNKWVQLVVSYNHENLKSYINGTLYRSKTMSGNAADTVHNALIGKSGDGYYCNNGSIDEIRISFIDRSAAWIKAEYYSGMNQLLSLGVEEAAGSCGESSGDSAITQGIQYALGPGAAIYPDQQIYARYADTQQKNGTFDSAVISGNQTWAFNYLTGGADHPNTTMANITPVLYVWERQNLTCTEITSQVQGLISSTKV